jgi:hypothetical protein
MPTPVVMSQSVMHYVNDEDPMVLAHTHTRTRVPAPEIVKYLPLSNAHHLPPDHHHHGPP